MAQGDWEKVLGYLAPAALPSITTRDAVAPDGNTTVPSSNSNQPSSSASATPWFNSNWVSQIVNYRISDQTHTGYDVAWYSNHPDASENKAYVVGVNLDWSSLNSSTGLLYKFVHEPRQTLEPLIYWPNQGDYVSVWSFDAAVEMFQNCDRFLQTWAPLVRGWADSINTTGSDWQGTAAGQFKSLLNQFALDLQWMSHQLEDNKYTDAISKARTQLGSGLLALANGYQSWVTSPLAWPVNAALQALYNGMAGSVVTWTTTPGTGTTDYTYNPETTAVINLPANCPFGSTVNDDFFKAVENAAHGVWKKQVADVLDSAASNALSLIEPAYATTVSALTKIPTAAPHIPLPPPSSDSTNNPFSDLQNNMNDQFKNFSNGMNDGFNSMQNSFGGAFGPGGTGGYQNNLFPPGFSTGGGNVPVLDSHGNPLLDSKGNPITVPPGSYIGAGGQVFDSNGNPVLGPDGKPLVVPPGSQVGSSDLFGGNAKVPPGSTIRSDGEVLGPDGKPVLDANGNPVYLGQGYTIAPDGTILGPGGKPVSQSTQNLIDQQHSFDTQFSGPSGRNDPSVIPSSYNPGGYDLGGTGFGGGSGFNTGFKLSPTAVENGGDPATAERLSAEAQAAEQAAQEKAAAEAAAEEAALSGKGISTMGGGGAPMMPPMGGMGGAPHGEQGKDRQRTTWLAEEEEVWGTETGAVTGVIGR